MARWRTSTLRRRRLRCFCDAFARQWFVRSAKCPSAQPIRPQARPQAKQQAPSRGKAQQRTSLPSSPSKGGLPPGAYDYMAGASPPPPGNSRGWQGDQTTDDDSDSSWEACAPVPCSGFRSLLGSPPPRLLEHAPCMSDGCAGSGGPNTEGQDLGCGSAHRIAADGRRSAAAAGTAWLGEGGKAVGGGHAHRRCCRDAEPGAPRPVHCPTMRACHSAAPLLLPCCRAAHVLA